MRLCLRFFMIVIAFLGIINRDEVTSKTILIPDDAIEFNGHCYKLYCVTMTWDEAEIFCESIGGHLAVITTPEENEFAFLLMKESGYDSAYFGLTDQAEEGVWQWINGEEYIYKNWNLSEPNNQNGNEDYAMFYYKYDNGEWNDGDFNEEEEKAIICEWDFLSSSILGIDEDEQQHVDNSENQENIVDDINIPTIEMEDSDDGLSNSIEDSGTSINNINDSNNSDLNSNKGINIIFHFGNWSIFGGLSVFGGFSLIKLIRKIIKEKRN